MRRALVIGISGAGKSTFSKRLAEATRLPLIHLDREFWQPGWNVTLREPWRAKVKQLAQRESWIMDGNFDSSLDLRLPRADTVFWFDYPTFRCLRRVLWRTAVTYGQVRSDLAPGCPERWDLPFLRYVWNFNARDRNDVVGALERYGKHAVLHVFRRDADVKRYLETLAG
jgi:adenylate kinase family enzyme